MWLSTLSQLGLTPAAAARILRDAGIAKAAVTNAAFRDLAAHIEAEHAEIEA